MPAQATGSPWNAYGNSRTNAIAPHVRSSQTTLVACRRARIPRSNCPSVGLHSRTRPLLRSVFPSATPRRVTRKSSKRSAPTRHLRHAGRMPPTVSVDLTAEELDLLRRALLELTVDLEKRVKEGLRGSHREARRDRHEGDLEAARLLSIKLMETPRPA